MIKFTSMRKFFLAASLAVFMMSCTNQQQSDSASQTASAAGEAVESGAVFVFEKDSYDFGKVPEGEKVEHEFKFKNEGTGPLIINDAQASCGCTIPEYPKEPVAPGEEGVIKVIFNSEGRFGKQNKVITITSNADPSTTELYLTGEVLEKK